MSAIGAAAARGSTGCQTGRQVAMIAKSITVYGIKNCDTMKKARAWLDAHGVAYDFHDYKGKGIEPERVRNWAKEVGWEALLNRSGTTFRKLADDEKTALDENKALALMALHPTLIRRPVLDLGDRIVVGFKPDVYAEALPQ
jgi:arsenate reductase